MTAATAILSFILAYLAIAVFLAFSLRRRWVRWYEQNFPDLAREQGHHAPGWFVATCAFWPIYVPMFITYSARNRGWTAAVRRRVERWMQSGAS